MTPTGLGHSLETVQVGGLQLCGLAGAPLLSHPLVEREPSVRIGNSMGLGKLLKFGRKAPTSTITIAGGYSLPSGHTALKTEEAASEGVRGLASLLMDRHKKCQSHFWCGVPKVDMYFKVVVGYRSSSLTPGHTGYVAAWLSQAKVLGEAVISGNPVPMLGFATDVPTYKLTIEPTTEAGIRLVQSGPVVGATPGDHSSGVMDTGRWGRRVLADVPTWVLGWPPDYADITPQMFDARYEPHLGVVRRHNAWDIYMEAQNREDRNTMSYHHVAAIPISADNPAHNGKFAVDGEYPIMEVPGGEVRRGEVYMTQGPPDEARESWGHPELW